MKKLLKSKLLSGFLAFTMVLGLVTIPVKEVKAEVAAHLVISEAYGGGGNSGATYTHDFIELYNPTDQDISIDGWQIQYASATGEFGGNNTNLSGIIKAKSYFLTQHAKGSGGTEALPTPDLIGTLNMGGKSFKVQLLDKDGNRVDLLGVGEAVTKGTSLGFETAAASILSNTTSAQRKDNDGSSNGDTNGWDTDNNSLDFYVGEPTPRNSKYSSSIIELIALKVDENISLEIEETKNISVGYEPENTTEKSVRFESLNSEIATVDNEGKVTGIKEGETTIKVISTLKENIFAEVKVTVNKGEDKKGPEITDIYPGAGQNLGDLRRPEIKATVNDESGINNDSIKLYLNGNIVTANITNNIVSYNVSQDLEDGQHTIKLEVKDTLGNLTEKEWSFRVGEVTKNLYFGQLHSHTNLSDGTGSIDEAYKYAKNVANVDFLAVTDHSNWFDNDTKGTIADGSASSEWKLGHQTADNYNLDNEFVAVYAYEMTWSGSTGGYGHMNTFNTPGFETRSNSKMNLQAYYAALKTQPQSISMFNHPGKTFGNFTDFAHYDKEIDKLITLIEVGNGEGEVRSSGYFPSYEYYTRALDKGWHLAPTNGQDNHKGKWGNANTTRTVIEASELTRESLYQAMRDMRVYSTEDENLRISYEVNNNTMGTVLPKTNNLNFEVNVEDIDNGDNIKKISIIGDGGKIVKSIDNVNSTTKKWEFSLDQSVSSYYYVRVEQADKDIAVTAPVWVGERENFGISTVDKDKEVLLEGEDFNIETNIYNNEGSSINDIKIEYYKENEEIPFKSEIVNTIAAGGTVTAKLPYKFDKPGTYSFVVKVSATINGMLKEFKSSITIDVLGVNEVSTVVIDGAHQNQYVTGNYADKVTTLTALMAQNNIKAVINKEKITDKVLEKASLLILSDPESTTDTTYGLSPHKYDKEELEAIARFVQKGGNIAITSKADYKDANGDYGNASQGNSVLQAIGANIRFNDDQTTDDSNNGGQSYRLYFTNYNTESPWLNGIDTSKKYSFYSGATLVMPNDMTNIDVLVRGHETTYGNDADNQKDNVTVEKGKVVGLAVETLSSGAKVFISGATFFSNFEMDGLDYSNYQITEKMLKELAAAPTIAVSKISDVRIDSDNNNLPDRFGERVSVEGYVTAASNAAARGNSFFDVIYIQDETAGLTVFGVSELNIKLGQKVRVTGRVSSYLNDAQVALKNENLDVKIIDENINLVEPTKLSTKDSMLEEKEGLLVKVEGKITRIEGQNIFVNDGSGESRVYVEGYIGSSINPGVADEWKSRVYVGDTISAIGLASEDPEGHRLRVRDSAEIIKINEEVPEINVTGVSLDKSKAELKINESLELKANIQPLNATNKEVTWTTSDEKIAKIDGNGKVTAIGAGKAIITVTTKDGEFKAVCEVTVNNVKDDNGTTDPKENIVEKIENPNGKNEVVISNPSNSIKLEIKDIEALRNGNGSFEIKNGDNTIILPFELVDKSLLKDGSSLILEMNIKEDTTIISGIKAVKKVFEFNLFVKDGDNLTYIHNFKNGFATIKIKLSDEDLKGLNKENLSAFYYNEESKKFEQLETTINGNEVTFKTPHFSKFIIAEKATNESGVTLPATGGNNPIYILLIALLTIGVGTTLFMKRKNNIIVNK